MDVAERILRRIEDILHMAGCLALLAVVCLINGDILLRLFVGTPVQVQFELTELYLMPAIAMLSLSRVFRDGGHLALDFLPEALGRAFGGMIERAALILPAALFAAVTFMSGRFALNAIVHGEVEYGVIDWPLGWAYAAVPLGCGVLVLRLLHDALANRVQEENPEKELQTGGKTIETCEGGSGRSHRSPGSPQRSGGDAEPRRLPVH